ncbi:CD109 antigen-like [Watersipora subatra]|uniref:CD109 antigen-like n=1 Tax=Watersipora subatra TaxID=2589382 RepID=UPI00355BFAD0
MVWESGDYLLNVSNDVFSGFVEFKVKVVPYAILIQTDKPIYKPSQTVNIRVAIIDDKLIPRNETVDVIVKDSEGNKIQQWKNKRTFMGLLQLSLPLSDRPPLGDWTITVDGEETSKEKTVKVDEYVLPRFEVTVELPSYILKKATTLTCTVRAQYTYGEDVNGDLSITFASTNNLTKTGIKINGVTQVTLNLDDIQTIGLAFGVVTAEASVYEPLSGKTLSGSGSTKIAVSDYEVTFLEVNSKAYRPGQDYTGYFQVARPDGQKIKGESNDLSVTLEADYGSFSPVSVRAEIPDSGIVPITVTMPSNDYYYVTLTAEVILENGDALNGVTVDSLSKFQSENANIYLQILSDITGVSQVGDTVTVTVSSSKREGPFDYAVTSGGRIVSHGSGSLSSGTATFAVSVTQEFTPQAYLVVSATVENEFLADSISFNIDGAFQNEVSVEFTDTQGAMIEETTPGSDVNVKVGTEAGSTVALLSVDKSVLLLAGGNDITQTQIITELMSLVETESACEDDEDNSFFFFGWPRFGGKSSEDITSKAGFVLSTDAAVRGCYPDNYYYVEAEIQYDGGGYYADAAGPLDLIEDISSQADNVKKRQFFPETWLWDLKTSEDGSLEVPTTVPDTITTWVTTAISMHPTSGIAVTAEATELTVKLPFFITAILPYAAVKGEELQLKIVVNNYGDADDLCTVTVAGSEQFDVKEGENELYSSEGADLELPAVSVSKDSGAVVVLWLNPKVLGTIQLSASAICSSGAADAFQRDLLVKPPGYPQEKCESKLIQIEQDGADVTETFNIYIDGDYVPDSKWVEVQVTGDVLGPAIDGLERLVQMPYGCGEQNMVTFTPNIFVRAYLEHIGELDVDIEQKTSEYMIKGYQRELTYKRNDGSFSAFGNIDNSGSTWLTAFVMKCFRQASLYVEIDLDVLDKSLVWLNNQKSRSTSGMFDEPGRVIHSDMQGGVSGGITLSAFVVIAILEDVTGSELTSRTDSLASTISYLENSMSTIENNAYQMSIVTYALHLAESNQADAFLIKLEALQSTDAGLVWWQGSGPSASVEMTSYALLTYVKRNDLAMAKGVALWLTETRNSAGGYHSTQDTTLGLQSLAAYAQLVFSNSTNLLVKFETSEGGAYDHTITSANAILTKKHSFVPAESISRVTADISGYGSTVVTACTGYNVGTLTEEPTTKVVTDVTKPSDDSPKTNLEACILYFGEGDSGMGLTEVKLPTGFSVDLEDTVLKSGDLARMESTSDGLAFYWNVITPEESCVVIQMVQDTVVNDVQDSYVTGAQYYKTETGSRSFYNPQTFQVVDDVTPGSGTTAGAAYSLFAITAAALFLYTL